MITKITTHKIEHQLNVRIFVLDFDNFIQSKFKKL
jgi:hypothetical protein